MNSMLWLALAAAAPAAVPEWAPIVMGADAEPTLFFIDRTSIKATADGSSAWAYVVPAKGALRLHVEYDCGGERYRYLEAALPADAAPGSPAATPWAAVKPVSPMNHLMRYVCSGGKIDFGFGDIAIKAPSPEAFTREFMARRAKMK
jgi:hypothetical protein